METLSRAMSRPGGALRARLRGLRADRRGALMLDAIIAMLAFSMVGFAVMGGLSTTQLSSTFTEGESIAENLARNQMDVVFSEPYVAPPTSYTPVSAPAGFLVSATAEEYVLSDPNVQLVTVEVTRDGVSVLVIETLRTKQ